MRSFIVVVVLASVLTATRTAAPQEQVYASEAFLAELLCEGETEGRSCGVDYRGVPMVCGRDDSCDQPCLRCYRTAAPDTNGPAPAVPRLARLPETSAQSIERIEREGRIRGLARLSHLGFAVTLAGGVLLCALVAKRSRRRLGGWALLTLGLAMAFGARWGQEREEERLADAVRAREVFLIPLSSQGLPPTHWNALAPERDAYEAQIAHLERALEARGIDWAKRARQAGEAPREY